MPPVPSGDFRLTDQNGTRSPTKNGSSAEFVGKLKRVPPGFGPAAAEFDGTR